MNEIVSAFFSLPSTAIYMICGAAAGVFGNLLGTLISRFVSINYLQYILVVAAIVLSVHLLDRHLPDAKLISETMEETRKISLFATLFKAHPEAEEVYLKKLEDIIEETPHSEIQDKFINLAATTIQEYLNKYMISAKTEIVYKLIKRNEEVLNGLGYNPKMCVNYYLGAPDSYIKDLPSDFIKSEIEIKTEILESALNSPEKLQKFAGIEGILQKIIDVYVEKGFATVNLSKLETVSNMAPEAACKVVQEFSIALASFDPDEAVFIFKSLLHANKIR